MNENIYIDANKGNNTETPNFTALPRYLPIFNKYLHTLKTQLAPEDKTIFNKTQKCL